MTDTPEQIPTWAERVIKALDITGKYAADEVQIIVIDAIEDERSKLPFIAQPAPEPTSFAERTTPQRSLEQILGKASVECLKHYLGEQER